MNQRYAERSLRTIAVQPLKKEGRHGRLFEFVAAANEKVENMNCNTSINSKSYLEDRMNRFDSASITQHTKRRGSRLRSLWSMILTLLVVGSSVGIAQPTLTHTGPMPGAPGQICSGNAPVFDLNVPLKNTYTYAAAAVAWPGALAAGGNQVDITAQLGDDLVYEVAPGNIQGAGATDFLVRYYGKLHNLTTESFFIGTNGFVRFDNGIPDNVEVNATGILAQNIPNVGGVNEAIYFLNLDLAIQQGGGEAATYEVQNIAGEDVLVVTFDNVSQYNPNLVYPYNNVTVQLLIWEDGGANANRIEVRLTNWPDPAVIPARNHTIGVEDACGNNATVANANHNDDPWANANGAGEAANYSVAFTEVVGAAQTFNARLYVVGADGNRNTYAIPGPGGDDGARSSATLSNTTGAGPFSMTSNTVANFADAAGLRTYYAVVQYSDCTVEQTATVSFTVNQTPAVKTITGPTAACVGTVYNYSVTAGAGNTFSWTSTDGAATIVPAVPTLNANAATVNWGTGSNAGTAQTLTYTETSPAGCVATNTLGVTVYTIPVAVVTSPAQICSGSSGNFSVAAGFGSYAWSLGAGWPAGTTNGATNTNTFSVTPGSLIQPSGSVVGNVSVTITNGGLCSATFNGSTTVQPLPAVKTITANDATPCVNQTINYSVPATVGNSYAWTASGGTFAYQAPNAGYINGTSTLNLNAVNIQWSNAGSGRQMQVVESTPAGCTRTTTLSAIVVEALPTPTVTGPTLNVCGFVASSGSTATSQYQTVPTPREHTYQVALVNVANTYNWTITGGTIVAVSPAGTVNTATTASGVNANTITVRWNNPAVAGAGTVSVVETSPNNCAGTSPTLNVTTARSAEAADFSLAGLGIPNTPSPSTVNPCENATGVVYTGTVVPVGYTQQFYVLSGGSLASTTANTATVNWGAGPTGVIRHEVTNTASGCTSQEDYTININPLPTGNIAGNATVCGGTTGHVYTVTNVQNGPITNNVWSITAGGGFVATSVASGPGNNTYTIGYNNSGTGTVTIQNVITASSSGCSNTLTFNVAVTQTPSTPVITGNTGAPGQYVCAGQTYNYTISGVVGGLSTIVVTNGTASATSFSGVGPHNFTVTWGLVPAGGAGNIAGTVTFNNCTSPVNNYAVTISALPAVPVIGGIVPPICVNSPFQTWNVTNNAAGFTYSWSATGGLTGTTTNPGTPGTNEQFTVTNWGGTGNKVITVTTTNDVTGCTRQGTANIFVAAQPTPVITGPVNACNNVYDPAGMNGSAVIADPLAFTYVYSTAQVVGNYYSWTVTNGYIAGYSVDNGANYTALNPVATTNSLPIQNANNIRVVFYGPTPGKVKVSELTAPTSPPGCQTTTLDYNVNLNPFPVVQTLTPAAQDYCAGNPTLPVINQSGSQTTFVYRLEKSTDGGTTWTNVAVPTQTGTGAALVWTVPSAELPYVGPVPNFAPIGETYTFRATAQYNVAPLAMCGWYTASTNATVDVFPTPAIDRPVTINGPKYFCTGNTVPVEVGSAGLPTQAWVLYTLNRTTIPAGALTPITSALGNNGVLTMTDPSAPAGGAPLLNADNFQYVITAQIDPGLLIPPDPNCAVTLTDTASARIFALPTPQAVTFVPNPICYEDTLNVNLTASQDGVVYEVLRNGLSMTPPVLVNGDVLNGPVNVKVAPLQVQPTNPVVPVVVNFSIEARLRTGAAPYNRPVPASLCPNTFGNTAVTVNPKPVTTITPDSIACGPSTVNYTVNAFNGGNTYDWKIMTSGEGYVDAPVGTTPLSAMNAGAGTVHPFAVNWGNVTLNCNGTFNQVTPTIRVIETNPFGCPDTAFLKVYVKPTLTDLNLVGDPQACIYGGFEQHLKTYKVERNVGCVFPAGTTFLWTMPSGTVSGVIRSGQGTPEIIAEWHTTGGTGIGVVTCAATLPASYGGCTTTRTLNVQVYPLPVPVVNGPTSVCQGQLNVPYTADFYGTDTYNWLVFGGTIVGGTGTGVVGDSAKISGVALNNIQINWNDVANPNAFVRLRQVSAAGCMNVTTLNVTVNPTPNPVIGGPTTVCSNSTYTWSTADNTPNNSYVWNISGNGTIMSGGNTAAVTVMTGATGGFNLTLTETNVATTCTKTVTQAITIVAKPQQVITRTAPAGPTGGACLGQQVTYGHTDVIPPAAFGYQWTIVGGVPAGPTNGPTVTVDWNTVGAGSLTLSKWYTGTAAACTTSVTQVVNITNAPNAEISGLTTVCGNASYNYSTPFVVGNTYSWSLGGGGTITGGQGTNAISVMLPNPAPGASYVATVSVTETNTLSGCTDTDILSVTVRYQPVAQTITRVTPAGPVAQACNNDVIVYAVTNNSGSTFAWTATGGTVLSGGTTASATIQWTGVGNQVITVVETTNAGVTCTATSTQNVSVTYKPVPAISGNATPCTTVAENYSTPAYPGSTFVWSLPLGGGTINSGVNSNTVNVTWTATGARSIQVVETNGNCTGTATLNVTVGLKPVPVISRITPAGNVGQACQGETITYSTPNTPGNTYAWTSVGGQLANPTNTNQITVTWNTIGNQSITVTETAAGTNCSTTTTQNVSVTYKPTPQISGVSCVCLNKIQTYSTANVPGSNYLWSIAPSNSYAIIAGSLTSHSITVQWIQPGLHTVTLTETAVAGGCFTTVSMNVQVNDKPAPFITSVTGFGTPVGQRPGIVCANSAHTYTTNATPCNVFNWAISGGVIVSGQNTNTINVIWGAAGVGTIAVTETVPGSDCQTTKLDSISIRPVPTPVITGQINPCGGSVQDYTTPAVAGNGYTWTVVGGTFVTIAPNTIRVTWNTPVWPNIISGSVAVTEAVLGVLPANSCNGSFTRNVTVRPNPPVPSITGSTLVCATDLTDNPQTINNITYTTTVPVTDGNTGSVTPTWSVSANGTIIGGVNGASVQVQWTNATNAQTNGTVTVVHTSSFGCTSTSSLTVTINPLPNPVITGPLSVCQNSLQSYSTPGVAGNTYSWSVTGGNIIRSGATTPNAMVEWTLPGTYQLTVAETNAFGCTVQNRINVTVNELPNVTISASGVTTFCQGGDVTLSAPIGYASYVWSTGEVGRQIVVRTTGTYFVTVTDANGCSNTSNTITVNVFPSQLPIVALSGPTTFCEGGNVTLTAPNGFTAYRWLRNGEQLPQTTQSIVVTESGAYQAIIADNNGCTGTSTEVDVTVNPTPRPTLSVIGSSTLCTGDTVEVRAPAGYASYAWVSKMNIVYGTGRSIKVTSADTLSVTVVDINGCVGSSDTVNIAVAPVVRPVIAANGPTTFCAGGAVTLSAPAGYSSYYWSTGETTRTITVVDAGNYSVTVANQIACTSTSVSTPIVVNALPAQPTITRSQDILTAVSPEATAWQWYLGTSMLVGKTQQTLEVKESGEYRVEITDANTCSVKSQPMVVIITDVEEEPVAGFINELQVYPNPTNGTFTVSLANAQAGAVRVELVNMVGETVLTLNEEFGGGQLNLPVTMGNLATGVYNVVVTTSNERWQVRLVRQ